MTAQQSFERSFDENFQNPKRENSKQESIQRSRASYTNYDEKYKVTKRNFERQFSQLYFSRLVKLRPVVVAAAEKAWPGVPHSRILDVPEETEVVVVGTMYKDMALKPSILDEYTKDRGLEQHLGRSRFTQPSDVAILEDEGGRVTLTGSGIHPGMCVTGVITAVRGKVLASGDFDVVDVCYAGSAPQKPLPSIQEDIYVGFVSGFSLGSEIMNGLKLQMMLDYCSGMLGAASEQTLSASIVRLVVAGGILKGNSTLSQPTAYASVREQASALSPVRDADALLSELTQYMDVDVMPGAADPANYSLPQQPMHPCLFPTASKSPCMHLCTNPHRFDVGGVSFLGTSGQNVEDVARYSDIDGAVAIQEGMLSWRHIIPTAPDSLAAYPYSDDDPFIVDETPHVLFAGGQESFSTSLVKGSDGQVTRVIAIPEFSSSPVLVLVNVKNLDVHPIYFDTVINT